MQTQGATSPLTRLVPDLSGGVDPDDAFSRVPYEKGFNLLCVLADCLGGDEQMRTFFRAYVGAFKGRTVDSEQFKAFAEEWARQAGRAEQLRALDWHAWFHSPGMPPATRAFDRSLAEASAALASRWVAGETAGCSAADVAGWSSLQRQVLLDQLLDAVREQQQQRQQHGQAAPPAAGAEAAAAGAGAAPLGDAEVMRLGELYGFGLRAAPKGARGGAVNCEEAFRFYRLCLAVSAGGCSALQEILAFLRTNGRMKYVRPLYRDLCSSEQGRAAALPAFQAWRANYHPIAQHMLALDLGLRS